MIEFRGRLDLKKGTVCVGRNYFEKTRNILEIVGIGVG